MNSFVNAATAHVAKTPRATKPKAVKAPAPVVSTVNAVTSNGAKTRSTSGQRHVDLFAIIGSARTAQEDMLKLFDEAYRTDKATAMRIALWARDIRGGAGERKTFRSILQYLEKNDPVVLQRLVPNVQEFGRWDDLIDTLRIDSKAFELAATDLKSAIESGNGLAAKWTPRKGPVSIALRKAWNLTPKQYRKFIVNATNVVETKMCDKEWNLIEFDKIPSLAGLRYQKAFGKNAPALYAAFKSKLEKGEVKINSSTLYPHDIITAVRNRNGDSSILDAQWKALPDYMGEHASSVLVLSDVSGSMNSGIGGSVVAMDVSIALGLYISERQSGLFKDLVLTFSDKSKFHQVKGNGISERCNNLEKAEWMGSTNFQSSFDSILKLAVENEIPEKDMPKTLICISDMEFNSADRGTNFDIAALKFKNAGYTLPTIVFWNVNGREKNNPVTFDQHGTMMVSGYSPSILKSILSGATIPEVTPMDVMMEAIGSDRYSIADIITQ